MEKIDTIVVGQLGTNCYIIRSGREAMIVDPGAEPDRILRFVKDSSIAPNRIVATHTHFDHVL
ncbi:MAG TPA: MBL fold metallo-hydrolase, partial [Candidatus Bathyarchaeia archaeon]|nr:MBL fold metallo-hydrolase [Candidatus Bathyarchaeia archaeon]